MTDDSLWAGRPVSEWTDVLDDAPSTDDVQRQLFACVDSVNDDELEARLRPYNTTGAGPRQ